MDSELGKNKIRFLTQYVELGFAAATHCFGRRGLGFALGDKSPRREAAHLSPHRFSSKM
jgi:hypothetical protein